MKKINGFDTEDKVMKQFGGEFHPDDAVDFQTEYCLYEVKSCQLFLSSGNGNYKRKYIGKPPQLVKTRRLGRFLIVIENHHRLMDLAKKESKPARYIFAVVICGEFLLAVIPAEKIIIPERCIDKKQFNLSIYDIFYQYKDMHLIWFDKSDDL